MNFILRRFWRVCYAWHFQIYRIVVVMCKLFPLSLESERSREHFQDSYISTWAKCKYVFKYHVSIRGKISFFLKTHHFVTLTSLKGLNGGWTCIAFIFFFSVHFKDLKLWHTFFSCGGDGSSSLIAEKYTLFIECIIWIYKNISDEKSPA